LAKGLPPMRSLFLVLDLVLDLYNWAIIVWVILSWLTTFGIINGYNRTVIQVSVFLNRILEPALRPIRRFVPTLNGIDLSPLVLILAIVLVRNLIREYGLL
jgi:YggT family protein